MHCSNQDDTLVIVQILLVENGMHVSAWTLLYNNIATSVVSNSQHASIAQW